MSTAPDLTVGVSDPDSTNLTVTFYGRAKSTAGPNFTLVALPDTQNYALNSRYTSSTACASGSATFNTQTQWIVNHRTTNNIVFVSHLGDMTETGNNDADDSEWTVGDAAMDKLEVVTTPAGGIPYGFTPGNHDLTGGICAYQKWFGADALREAHPTTADHYDTDNRNSYDVFSASGMNFIVLNIDCSATPPTGRAGLGRSACSRRTSTAAGSWSATTC